MGHLLLVLVGRVAYVAPMCDLDNYISGLSQCFFYHFVDNCHFRDNLSMAVWLVETEVIKIFENIND